MSITNKAIVLYNGMIHSDNCFTFACVVGSSLLLACAHCWPACCAWFVFLFFVPLWYVTLFSCTVSFRHGFVWGLIFFVLQMQAIINVILAYGRMLHGLFLTFCLITYFALQTGVWFWCAHTACLIKRESLVWRTLCWGCMTHLFFWYVYYYGFFLVGIPHGYFAALFWLPLAHYSAWLSCISWIGIHSISLIILLISLAIVFCLHKGTSFCLGSALIIVFILIFIWRMPDEAVHVPTWIDKVCWLTIAEPLQRHPHDYAYAIGQALHTALTRYPQARFFIFPESTFPFALNEYCHLVDWWWDDLLACDSLIVLGGHYRCDKKLFNTLYRVTDVGITLHYDKKLLFPFIEYLPTLWNRLKKQFINHFCLQEFFCAAESCDTLLQAYCPLVPCICSELFLDTCLSSNHPSIMRLYLVNDSWFDPDYMKELMYLYAKIRTVAEGHASLYVSHVRGMYIDAKGSEVKLNA